MKNMIILYDTMYTFNIFGTYEIIWCLQDRFIRTCKWQLNISSKNLEWNLEFKEIILNFQALREHKLLFWFEIWEQWHSSIAILVEYPDCPPYWYVWYSFLFRFEHIISSDQVGHAFNRDCVDVWDFEFYFWIW